MLALKIIKQTGDIVSRSEDEVFIIKQEIVTNEDHLIVRGEQEPIGSIAGIPAVDHDIGLEHTTACFMITTKGGSKSILIPSKGVQIVRNNVPLPFTNPLGHIEAQIGDIILVGDLYAFEIKQLP